MEHDTAARVASPPPFKEPNEFIVIKGIGDNSGHVEVDLDLDSEASPHIITKPAEGQRDTLPLSESLQNTWDKEMANLSTSPPESRPKSASLLNNAVIKHEKDCAEAEDQYASTLAICNIFNSGSVNEDKSNKDKQGFHSDEDSNEDILITDLDSLSCDLQIPTGEKGGFHNGSHQQTDNEIDLSNNPNRSVSPNIVLLDLQSQNEYVTDFLNREESPNERFKKEELNLLQPEQIQTPPTPSECFSFESESVRDIQEKDGSLLHSNNNRGTFSPDFVREKNMNNSPVLFHDLNEYEQFLTKSFDRSDSTDSDAVFFVPISYSQTKDENRSSAPGDRFLCNSPQRPLNMSSTDMDYSGQCYELPVNDTGFFDTSHISLERSSNGALPEFSFKSSNQNLSTAKCNLNRHFFDSNNSVVTSSGFKLGSPYMSQPGNQLQIPGCAPNTSPFCFPSMPNPTITNSLPYNKQSVMDYGLPFQQNLPGYSDITESCSSSSCSEWNSWNTCLNQELSLSAVTPSRYISTPHLQQGKYTWQGESLKSENVDFYQEYLKPAINDNDSEETEDADEIEDAPILFNSSNFLTGYERQWPSHSNSYYSEAPLEYQMGMEGLNPGLASSNASSDTVGLHSPVPLQPTYSSPQCATEKVESNFINYEISPIPKLPFPSMADMMRNSRSSSTKSSGGNTKRIFSDNTSHATGNRFRKNQIQSDAISTSTSKGPRYRKKWPTEPKKGSQDVSDIFINLDGLVEAAQNRGPRRHNEPLKQNAIGIMSQWYEEHLDNPYPTKADKIKMAKEGGITVTQVKSWFANKRNRTNNTKPKVQKRAMEEKLKELFKDITCNRSMPLADNSHIINQLSGIIQTCNSNKLE